MKYGRNVEGWNMNEKYTEVLEQYDMEVSSVRKGRGAWICETDQGFRALREYRGTLRRLEFEDEVLAMLDTRTSLRADRYIRNREGSLLTSASDGIRYIVKEWFPDRECNIRDSYEIRQAISRLAMLHAQLRRIPFKEEWNMGSVCTEPLEEEMARHGREMRRARNYIREKRTKTEFELCVIGNYDMFYEQAKEAEERMRCLWAASSASPLSSRQEETLELKAAELSGKEKEDTFFLCHGDLDQHHVLIGPGYTAIVEYNRMHLGVQAGDLYRLMRKVLEKHGWNVDLGISMLDSYQRVLPMGKKERECLYNLFLFPEKYWKQLNFYYNTNKAWIPARNVEKLRNLEAQQPARNLFLKRLESVCG